MNYISVCSGIEAASVAWHSLGWTPLAFSEIEPFPSAVLAHHYPTVPNLGDMTKYHDWPDFRPNLIVGGTPCQAFSVAGLRQGLADPRGNLTLAFLGLVGRYRPEWVVWENVPGVLSDRTNAFGQLLAGLGQLGYGWAYRMLDAQYFGLAQRRKRVFVVAHLGDWASAAAVLFEPACLRGDTPPGREARQNIAPTLAARTKGGGGLGTDFDCDGGLVRGDGNVAIPFDTTQITSPQNYSVPKAGDPCHPLASGAHAPAVAIPIQEIGKRQSGTPMNGVGHGMDGDPMYTLQRGAVHGVATISPCLKGNHGKNSDAAMEASSLVAHSLRAEGFDASEDGTGRGTPLVPVWPAAIAPTLNASFGAKQGLEDQHALGGGGCSSPAKCLTVKSLRNDAETENLIPTRQGGFPSEPISFHPTQDPISSTDGSIHALGCGSSGGTATGAVAFQDTQSGVREYPQSGTLRANGPGHNPVGTQIRLGMSVRRLTPTECERLQGFPDGYTNIPWRIWKECQRKGWSYEAELLKRGMRLRGPNVEECPDGPRYKAIGNSMAVNCMEWLGHRIQAQHFPCPDFEMP